MKPHPPGLTTVATSDLRKALKALHQGDFDLPPSITGLTRVGLQHVALEMLSTLRGLDETGVRAVLVCVLAERLERESAQAGPSLSL
jgi:hypothetical protein